MTSFVDVHFLAGRAPLDKYCSYKHAILLHKIYNNHTPELDFIALSLNQNFNLRNANCPAAPEITKLAKTNFPRE